jgi:hypothetical protein
MRAKFLFAEGGHECETVRDAGFSGKENGELIVLAEKKFDVLVTIDKNIRYQQKYHGPRYRHFDCPCGIERSG